MLVVPTIEEIEAAWREIDSAGEGAISTMELALLSSQSERLAAVVRRLTEIVGTAIGVDERQCHVLDAAVSAALMSGLNYGLRIGAARNAGSGQAPVAKLPANYVCNNATCHLIGKHSPQCMALQEQRRGAGVIIGGRAKREE